MIRKASNTTIFESTIFISGNHHLQGGADHHIEATTTAEDAIPNCCKYKLVYPVRRCPPQDCSICNLPKLGCSIYCSHREKWYFLGFERHGFPRCKCPASCKLLADRNLPMCKPPGGATIAEDLHPASSGQPSAPSALHADLLPASSGQPSASSLVLHAAPYRLAASCQSMQRPASPPACCEQRLGPRLHPAQNCPICSSPELNTIHCEYPRPCKRTCLKEDNLLGDEQEKDNLKGDEQEEERLAAPRVVKPSESPWAPRLEERLAAPRVVPPSECPWTPRLVKPSWNAGGRSARCTKAKGKANKAKAKAK